MHFFQQSISPPPGHKKSPAWHSYVRQMKDQTRKEFSGKKHETPVFGPLAADFFRAPSGTATAPTLSMPTAWLKQASPEQLQGVARCDYAYFSNLAGMDVPPAQTSAGRVDQLRRLGQIVLEATLSSMPTDEQDDIAKDFAQWNPAESTFTAHFPDLAGAAFTARHRNAAPLAALMPDEPPVLPRALFVPDEPISIAEILANTRNGQDIER